MAVAQATIDPKKRRADKTSKELEKTHQRVVAQNVVIEDQGVTCLKSDVFPQFERQLRSAVFVGDQTWLYGYIEGLKRMRDHVLVNP